jgi:hypothetical protein
MPVLNTTSFTRWPDILENGNVRVWMEPEKLVRAEFSLVAVAAGSSKRTCLPVVAWLAANQD